MRAPQDQPFKESRHTAPPSIAQFDEHAVTIFQDSLSRHPLQSSRVKHHSTHVTFRPPHSTLFQLSPSHDSEGATRRRLGMNRMISDSIYSADSAITDTQISLYNPWCLLGPGRTH